MQNFLNWFFAVWPILLLAGALYFARNFFPAWIKRSAEFGFDKQIEELRGEISRAETRLNAELTAKQREIETLRDAALSGALSRQVALDARRLQAAEGIWNCVTELGNLKGIASVIGIMKIDEAAKEAAKNPNFRDLFKITSQHIDPKNLPGTSAAKQRPFLTEPVWAYYSALSGVLYYSYTLSKMLELGTDDPKKFMTPDSTKKLVLAALPHQANFIDQYGAQGWHLLIDELEAATLREIKLMLEGKESDAAALARAATILNAANAVKAETKAATPANKS